MERQARNAGGDNYPPFNIERRGDDEYRITLAVAGFRKPDLDIVAQQNLLVVTGKKRDELNDGEMLHIGIANRGFERRFELADYVRVAHADLADGLLVIDLVREVPDAMKPAASSRVAWRRSSGSCQTVMACRSTMQKIELIPSSWLSTKRLRAPR